MSKEYTLKKYLSICWNYVWGFFRKIFRGQVVEKKPITHVLEPKIENPIDSVEESKSGKAAVKPETEKLVESTVSPNVIFPVESTLYIGNDHWKLLLSFLSTATKSIRIITGSIAYDALSLILSHVQNGVSIKIATGRMKDYEEISQRIGVKSIKSFKRLHAKLCVVDGKRMLIGSSNITKGSLGDDQGRYGSLEANIIVDDSSIVESGKHLFNIIWNRKSDIDLLKIDNGFISSAYGIPFKIKELIQRAKKEIVIIIPPLFGKSTSRYKSIPKYIKDLNPDVKIKIITSHRINEYYEDAFNEIKTFDNTKIILAENRIHAKIYIFDWQTAIISSVNLEYPQWVSSLESGIITANNEILEIVKRKAHELESNIASLEMVKNLEEDDESTHGESLEKMEFCFETEGKGIIPELIIDEGVDDEKVKGRLTSIAGKRSVQEPTKNTSDSKNGHMKLSKGKKTNLIQAATEGDTERVKVLLEKCYFDPKTQSFKGFDVNKKDKDSNTALIWAAREGHIETVKALLTHGSMLSYAKRKKRRKKNPTLINLDIRNKFDKTALIYASEKGYDEIVQLLKQAESVDQREWFYAKKENHSVSKKEKKGRTSLMGATRGNNIKTVKFLLDKDVDVNETDKSGWTALIYAAWEGHTQIAKVLIDRHADVNKRDETRKTALIWATIKGNLEIVEILINNGAHVNIRDIYGNTPLMKSSNMKITQLLKQAGAKE
ncbi:ankyrin repeat domain-containing protein [bacterium]|nr:ankyrin repeat domain-containing protein [bacterium]